MSAVLTRMYRSSPGVLRNWLRGAVAERIRRRQIDAAVADLLDDLIRAVRSGATIGQALVEAAGRPGPLNIAVADVARGLALGQTVDDAVERLRRPGGSRATAMAATVIGVAAAHPAGATDTLQAGADSIRAEVELGQELTALVAQAQLSARVLTLLPVVMVALALARGGRAADAVLGSSVGLLCLAAAAVLVAVGWVWMRSMVAAVVPR